VLIDLPFSIGECGLIKKRKPGLYDDLTFEEFRSCCCYQNLSPHLICEVIREIIPMVNPNNEFKIQQYRIFNKSDTRTTLSPCMSKLMKYIREIG
jgi:hypothetical protein